MNNSRCFPFPQINFLMSAAQLSFIVLLARFNILRQVFLTQNLPLGVYFIYSTKGRGSYGVPFLRFLLRYATSSLAFYFSLCCQYSYYDNATSPIELKSCFRKSYDPSWFLERPKNYIVLFCSTNYDIYPLIYVVIKFP